MLRRLIQTAEEYCRIPVHVRASTFSCAAECSLFSALAAGRLGLRHHPKLQICRGARIRVSRWDCHAAVAAAPQQLKPGSRPFLSARLKVNALTQGESHNVFPKSIVAATSAVLTHRALRRSSFQHIFKSPLMTCLVAAAFFWDSPNCLSQAQQLPLAPGTPLCISEISQTTQIAVCTLNIQAGIPYSGKLATYRTCAGKPSELRFSVFWDGITTRSGLKYDGVQRGVLLGTHTWMNPGDYQLKIELADRDSRDRSAGANADCSMKDSSGSGVVHVFAPQPPSSMFISARKLQPGRTYKNAGAVALRQAAPASGTLLVLETDQPGKVDVQTSFGRTEPGKRRTYLWIEPGTNTRPFDLIIAADVPKDFQAEIKSDCAGAILPKSECDAGSNGGIAPSKVFPIKIH